jgi:alginate O-acetyltransferase complex protein AlgI
VATQRRLYLNLWLVFLASGLWHGASWSFILWGAYHGLFLVIERGFLLKIYEKIGKLPSMMITFFIVIIGWVFFRIEKISDAFVFLKRLFVFESDNLKLMDSEFYCFLFIAIAFSFITCFKIGKQWQDSIYFDTYSHKKHIYVFALAVILLLFSISSITAFGFNPFIYFRF